MSSEIDEKSAGGSDILHHGEPAGFEPAQGEVCIEQISDHIEEHLGPISSVYHEMLSDTVHIDVHVVPATEEFPYLHLITSGMSDLPMQVPPDSGAPRYMELMITLPGDWPLDHTDLEDERHYWPIRLLKWLARFPHKHATWLGRGHTIPNQEPFADNVAFDAVIILPSVVVPEEFRELVIDADKTITFMAVVPLYPEELALKLEKGTDALIDGFIDKEINDICLPGRPNAATKRSGLF